ncbi:MAG TPA: hypothetical protein VLA48_03120 [Nitrososphaeraceae archaeon]|nr:hypothetical protein [Nitrososphaeraceae archaeon]
MEFICNCHLSGVNSFTGKCDTCGMSKVSGMIERKPSYLNQAILDLERYSEVYDRGHGVLKHPEGEFVKLDDVLRVMSLNSFESL